MDYRSILIKNKLILFLFFSFLLKIVFSYFFGWQEIPSDSDGVSYNGYALAILNNSDWLTNPDFLGHYRPPAYPFFLAIIYFIFGTENFIVVYFFQAILATLVAYYIYKLSGLIFGDSRSYVSLFWAGIYVFYIHYSSIILRETLVHFLIIFSFYHLWIFFDKTEQRHLQKSTDLLKFIIAFAFLFHTDGKYLFYIPFVAVLFIIYRDFWDGIKQYLWALLIMVLMLCPWVIRNYIAYDYFVLVNIRTQEFLDTRTNKFVSNFTGDEPYDTNKIASKEIVDYPSEEERALVKQGKNPKNRTPEEISVIKKDVFPPSTFLEKKMYELKEMWLPFRFWYDYDGVYSKSLRGPWSLRHNFASILFYGTLIPFLFYGLFNLFKTRQKVVWFLISPILIHALLHFLAAGRTRHRTQIDAFIIILGCYGIVLVYGLIKEKISNKNFKT